MEKKEKVVLEAMKKAGKPIRPGDVVKLTQMDKEEVSAIMNQLKKEGKIVCPKRCFYQPA